MLPSSKFLINDIALAKLHPEKGPCDLVLWKIPYVALAKLQVWGPQTLA
jgi:hypothetical protein